MVITRIPFSEDMVPFGVLVFMIAAKLFWIAKHMKNDIIGWTAVKHIKKKKLK